MTTERFSVKIEETRLNLNYNKESYIVYVKKYRDLDLKDGSNVEL